jgi:hypothetical protein
MSLNLSQLPGVDNAFSKRARPGAEGRCASSGTIPANKPSPAESAPDSHYENDEPQFAGGRFGVVREIEPSHANGLGGGPGCAAGGSELRGRGVRPSRMTSKPGIPDGITVPVVSVAAKESSWLNRFNHPL